MAGAPVNACSCRPFAIVDWWAFVPENGAGLLVTQFHVSPPVVPAKAPAGSASSIQGNEVPLMTVIVPPEVPVVVVPVVPVLVLLEADARPMLSHVALPP